MRHDLDSKGGCAVNGLTIIMLLYGCLGYGLLTFATATYLYHHFVWIPRVKRALHELNRSRAGRVREALATGQSLEIAVPPTPSFPFVSWVDLQVDGKVVSAGRTFGTDEIFQVTARDERNILRASATCDGKGTVIIASHGQTFVTRFLNGKWEVQTSDHPNA